MRRLLPREVAEHLGTEHHELYVTAREAQRRYSPARLNLWRAIRRFLADPDLFVSAFARSEVKVALSGDGGDELFGGYNRYLGLARACGSGLSGCAAVRARHGGRRAGMIPAGCGMAWRACRRTRPQAHFGGKIQKSLPGHGTRVRAWMTCYGGFLDEWWEDGRRFGCWPTLTRSMLDPVWARTARAATHDVSRRHQLFARRYPVQGRPRLDGGQPGIPRAVPRPSRRRGCSAHSARAQAAWREGKYILRQLLYREAPRQLFERPKAGFAIPVGEWIKGPLRPGPRNCSTGPNGRGRLVRPGDRPAPLAGSFDRPARFDRRAVVGADVPSMAARTEAADGARRLGCARASLAEQLLVVAGLDQLPMVQPKH